MPRSRLFYFVPFMSILFISLAETGETTKEISRLETDNGMIITLIHVEYNSVVEHLGRPCKVMDEKIYIQEKNEKRYLLRSYTHYKLTKTVNDYDDVKEYWRENGQFHVENAFPDLMYLYPKAVLSADPFLLIYCVSNADQGFMLVFRKTGDTDKPWALISTRPIQRHDLQSDEIVNLSRQDESIRLNSNKFSSPKIFSLSELTEE